MNSAYLINGNNGNNIQNWICGFKPLGDLKSDKRFLHCREDVSHMGTTVHRSYVTCVPCMNMGFECFIIFCTLPVSKIGLVNSEDIIFPSM